VSGDYTSLVLTVSLLTISCWLMYAIAWPIWTLVPLGPRHLSAYKLFLLAWGALAGGFAGASFGVSQWGLVGATLIAPVASGAGIFVVMLLIGLASIPDCPDRLHAQPALTSWRAWLRPFHSLPDRPKRVLRALGVALSIAVFAGGVMSDAPGKSLALIIILWRLGSMVADAVQDARWHIRQQVKPRHHSDSPARGAAPSVWRSGLRARIAHIVWGIE
jgi:hypothetical protein